MELSPYFLKLRSKLTGNTIESYDMDVIRRDVISDIRQLKAVIDAHVSEV